MTQLFPSVSYRCSNLSCFRICHYITNFSKIYPRYPETGIMTQRPAKISFSPNSFESFEGQTYTKVFHTTRQTLARAKVRRTILALFSCSFSVSHKGELKGSTPRSWAGSDYVNRTVPLHGWGKFRKSGSSGIMRLLSYQFWGIQSVNECENKNISSGLRICLVV